MIALLDRSGPLGQTAFFLVVLGMPLLAGVLMAWRGRQDPAKAALAAAESSRKNGQSIEQQYVIGYEAALRAAFPTSSAWLGMVLLAWAGFVLALALANFLGTPSLSLVTDVLRGRQELAPGHSSQDFTVYLSRTITAGGLASLLAVPALLFAALGYGFVRAWLPGAPLDRALVQLAAATAAPSAAPVPENPGWSAVAFLAGPFWFLYRGSPRQALTLLVSWLGLLLAGTGVWVLVARLVWGGSPLAAGTLAGVIWQNLLPTLCGLFSLPVFLYAGIRCPGTSPAPPVRESGPATLPPAP